MVVGAASRDLDRRDPRGWRLGGGVTYSAMALARLGVRVGALIGLDADATEARELDVLRQAGVDIRPIPLARGPVFDNRETAAGRVQLVHQASDRLTADQLPPAWRQATCFLLNPVAGEIGDEWADVPPAAALVALGWQGLVRRLLPGKPVEQLALRPSPLIARADAATISIEDAAGGADVALDLLLRRDGQQLVITRDRGMSLHVQRRGATLRARTVPVRPARTVTDPTGAGDVFLAAWTAGVLASRSAGVADEPWRALAVAAAAAAAKVEVDALADMPTLAVVCRRLVTPPADDLRS